MVNVLLPLAAALGEMAGDEALACATEAAYAAHPPLAENWITRLVRERAGMVPTGERTGAGYFVASAQAQQGLIAIYEGPCRDLWCGECPLGEG